MNDDSVWIRTCQECGTPQETKAPDTTKELPTSYTNKKCRVCKSESLDYGSYQSRITWPLKRG